MKKLFVLGVLSVSLIGCVSNPAKPMNQADLVKLRTICIEHNVDVSIPSFEDYIVEGLARHGIKSQTYKGVMPAHCENKLTYVGLRSWDLANYVSVINLKVYDKSDDIVARVDWQQNPMAPNKWRNAKGKVFDAVDMLLGKTKQKDSVQ